MIDLKKTPSANDLRWFARLAPIFFFGLGFFVSWRHASVVGQIVAAICWSLAVTTLLLALFWQAGLRRFYRTWLLLTYPIGWVVSHLVLALVFYLIFMPLGLILRRMGHDPLQLRPHKNIATYWRRRPPPPAAPRYFQQF